MNYSNIIKSTVSDLVQLKAKTITNTIGQSFEAFNAEFRRDVCEFPRKDKENNFIGCL